MKRVENPKPPISRFLACLFPSPFGSSSVDVPCVLPINDFLSSVNRIAANRVERKGIIVVRCAAMAIDVAQAQTSNGDMARKTYYTAPISLPTCTSSTAPDMNSYRPSLLDAALRTCTRSPRSTAYRNALRRRPDVAPRRCVGDMGPKPPTPPMSAQGTKVIAPKTRLVVGVVFIGALIYSMVGF